MLHEIWVKAYGAGLHAAAAAYAGALLIASCVLFIEYQYAVGALHDHYLVVGGAKACHAAAHYYLAGIFGIAAALAYGVGNYGSHAKAQIGGLLYAALYGGDAADERLTLYHCIGYGLCGADVYNYDVSVQRQLLAWNFSAGDGVDQLLFRALRIFGEKGHDLYPLAALRRTLHCGYGVGLVILDTDNAPLYAEGAHRGPESVHYALGFLDHEAVVAGNVGLALCAVEDNGIAVLTLAHGKLYMGGEGRAAHTADACRLYRGNYLSGVALLHAAQRLQLCPLVLEIVPDGDDGGGSSQQKHLGAYGRNLSRNAGMNR